MAILNYQGHSIDQQAETRLVSLTDLWKAAKRPATQRPLAWVGSVPVQKVLGSMVMESRAEAIYAPRQESITGIVGMLVTERQGGTLRTYATPEIALLYTHDLGEEIHEWALQGLGAASGTRWLAQLVRGQQAEEQYRLKRRALLTAGWAIPVVTVVGLSQHAQAQVSGQSTTTTTTTAATTTAATTTAVTTTAVTIT